MTSVRSSLREDYLERVLSIKHDSATFSRQCEVSRWNVGHVPRGCGFSRARECLGECLEYYELRGQSDDARASVWMEMERHRRRVREVFGPDGLRWCSGILSWLHVNEEFFWLDYRRICKSLLRMRIIACFRVDQYVEARIEMGSIRLYTIFIIYFILSWRETISDKHVTFWQFFQNNLLCSRLGSRV